MNNQYKITVIGRGNVGSHLVKAFKSAGCEVQNISSRNLQSELPPDSNLYLLCVKDNCISAIAAEVSSILSSQPGEFSADTPKIIAHTSGAVSLEDMLSNIGSEFSSGVFYPMQTFNKDIEMEYHSIPILIEADNIGTEIILVDIAKQISDNVSIANSQIRADYHLAAVLACNFTNRLCTLAEKYLTERNLDFNVLRPLIKQTAAKILGGSPADAQTGPAARRDFDTINRHLYKLESDPTLHSIYTLLTNSIIENE